MGKTEKAGETEGRYLRTDLAVERAVGDCPGVHSEERTEGAVGVFSLVIESEEGARAAGRPVGRYVTVSFGKPWMLSQAERDEVSGVIARELSALIAPYGFLERGPAPFLAAGLGNRRMTADAVGPGVIDKLTVSAHLPALDPTLFSELHRHPVAAIAPGVLGDTGMESAETVRAVVGSLRPRAVIAIDALAARSVSRLTTTVQLCDTGIRPGSGVLNSRPAIDRESLGVPVFAVGVPTVVDSSTLVCEMLGRAGVGELPAETEEALHNGKSFFVCPKEIDAALEALSDLLAAAIDRALEL